MLFRSLPVDPDAVNETVFLLKDPNVNFAMLSKKILRDHGLLTRVLSSANSPGTGLPQKIYTIDRAIIILGLEKIKTIITEAAEDRSFIMNDSDDWYRNTFWRHSILVANAAKSISEDLRYKKPGHVFITGLMHDIGIFIIRNFFPDEYSKIEDLAEEDGFSHIKAEEVILGLSHSEIGKILLEQWNLPDQISDAVENHHFPSNAEEGIIISSIVHLADFMVSRYGMSNNHWDRNLVLDEGITAILKLNNGEYEERIPFAYQDMLTEILSEKRKKEENYS